MGRRLTGGLRGSLDGGSILDCLTVLGVDGGFVGLVMLRGC